MRLDINEKARLGYFTLRGESHSLLFPTLTGEHITVKDFNGNVTNVEYGNDVTDFIKRMEVVLGKDIQFTFVGGNRNDTDINLYELAIELFEV